MMSQAASKTRSFSLHEAHGLRVCQYAAPHADAVNTMTNNALTFLETPLGDPSAQAGRIVGGFFIDGKALGTKTRPSGSRALRGRIVSRCAGGFSNAGGNSPVKVTHFNRPSFEMAIFSIPLTQFQTKTDFRAQKGGTFHLAPST